MSAMAQTIQEVLAWYAANHPEVCGHRLGYRQTSRVRSKLKAMGADPDLWPVYDEACKAAWADAGYTSRRSPTRGSGKRGTRTPMKREHGTKRGLRQHYEERSRKRREGTPEWALPKVCRACAEAGRRDEPLTPRPLPPEPVLPGQDAAHGSVERLEYEMLLQGRLKAARAPQEEIDAAVCEVCAKVRTYRRMKRRMTKVDRRLQATSS